MGTDYTATLCFGIKIEDDKLDNLLNEEAILLDKDLSLIYSGSQYSEEATSFVCIKQSKMNARLYNKDNYSIKYEELIAKSEWKERLKQWAAENNCFKPKIGWWLLVSES
jgi:hypothetical protein